MDVYRAVKATYPDQEFEFMHFVHRLKPLEDFIHVPQFAWTGGAATNIASYNAYFDNATNPVIGGLGFNDGDRSFCDDLNSYAHGHHIMGGAKMGAADDEMAVVDSRGRVYGIKGLRVVDAAVAPIATSGNPWVTFYQTGNVLGNLIAEDWGYDTANLNKNSNPVTNVNHPYYKNNLQI